MPAPEAKSRRDPGTALRPIAFLTDSFLHDRSTGINGTQVQMYNLAAALTGRGRPIGYIALTRGQRCERETIAGIDVHWIPVGRRLFNWFDETARVGRVLDEIGPQVVYQRGRSHLTYAAARWCRANGARFVWASNGEDSGEHWKLVKRLRRRKTTAPRKVLLYAYSVLPDVLIHHGIRGADRVIAQTEHQRRRIQENFGKQSVILPSVFPAPTTAGAPKKERLVLWLANLARAKQPEVFLELARAMNGLDGWRFVLAGGTSDARYACELRVLSRRLGNVEMIGSVPFEDGNALFARASVFVNTSRAEADGVPNAFIQSWHHGTPTVSLNHDPNGWITSEGLGYCAGGEMEAFLSNARTLLQDPDRLAIMGEACRRFARATFASDNLIERYLDVFKGP